MRTWPTPLNSPSMFFIDRKAYFLSETERPTLNTPPKVVPTSTSRPRSSAARELLLVFADTPVERRLIDSWIARSGREDVEVVEAGGAALQSELAAAGQELRILPVGVIWLPSDGSATGRLAGLMSAHGPTAWRRLTQDRVTRTRPSLNRVLEGQPATVEELRGRFEAGSAAEGAEAFVAFVRRQGLLALERARRAVVGQQYKTARLVPQEVLASARFHERAKQLADELGRSEESVLEEAAAYLKEMEAMHNAFAVDAWQSFTNRVISSYSIESDERQIENLRRLGGEHALVYLPSHRSYLDPFILRSVFHRHGLAPNYVLGGINTGFWPVGPVARRNGIVFIRRSYQDKPVYSATLREYIGYLVRKRFNLEWYIEGGRSRTGKLRPPRYGILAYVIGAVARGQAEDACLVPVAITYDQLREVSAMAAEQRGAAKQPEGLSWLLGYARAQGDRLGQAHVRVGEPFSLREALASVAQSANGEAASRDLSVEKVAFEVMHRINRATPVTPVA